MRMLAIAVLPLVLAGPAWAQDASAALETALLGTWKCSGDSNGMKVTGTTNYAAGGSQTFDVSLTGGPDGMAMELAGSGTGTWKLVDGKLLETFTSIKVSSAKLNGQVIPNEQAQPLVEGMVLDQTIASTVEMNTGSMVLVDHENVTHTCTR